MKRSSLIYFITICFATTLCMAESKPKTKITRSRCERMIKIQIEGFSNTLEGASTTETEGLPVIRVIRKDEFYSLTPIEAKKLHRQVIDYIFNHHRAPQELLLLSDFSSSEQDLIKRLNRSSKKWKVSEKNQIMPRFYLKEEEDYVRKEGVFGWENLEAYNNNYRIRKNALASLVSEVAACVIILRNGNAVIKGTTDRNFKEVAEDSLTILDFISKEKIEVDDIAYIKLFHTHPYFSPLSPAIGGDIAFVRDLKAYFRKKGRDLPIHIYAISEYENELFIFHAGGGVLFYRQQIIGTSQ